MSSPVLLQLTFTTGTLTVLNVRAVTLSDEDFGTGDPYRLTANGIVASRSTLTGIRIPTEADLDEQNIPRDIQFGWRKSVAPVQELPMRLAQLLNAVRTEGGVWTGSRARKAYGNAGWDCTVGRGYTNLKLLAQRGYLTQTGPRKMSYVLAAEQVQDVDEG